MPQIVESLNTPTHSSLLKLICPEMMSPILRVPDIVTKEPPQTVVSSSPRIQNLQEGLKVAFLISLQNNGVIFGRAILNFRSPSNLRGACWKLEHRLKYFCVLDEGMSSDAKYLVLNLKTLAVTPR